MTKFLPDGQAPKRRPKNIRGKVAAIAAFLLAGSGIAAPAQGGTQTFDIDLKDATLVELFRQIERQGECSFVYNIDDIRAVNRKDYRFSDATLAAVLDHAVAGTPLLYEIKDNHVIITKGAARQQRQSVRVSGRVTDRSGEPLAGVAVTLKGTTAGTATDANGYYSLSFASAPGDTPVLVFTFLGMETREEVLQGRTTVNVSMTTAEILIDEVRVINTGYRTIDRRKATSAIDTYSMDELKVDGLNTIDQMLEGHVPGLTFIQNSGNIGATPRLRIRGTSTVLGNQEPLWVIDGIVQTDPIPFDPAQLNDLDYVNLIGNSISGLNPEDIEQLDILKDAAATAIYGTRAANGVIVITTKRGKPGPPRIGYNFTGTFSSRPRYTDRSVNMMNSRERVDFSRELMEKNIPYGMISSWVGYEGAMYDYYNGKTDFDEFERRVAYYETLNTDWFDILTRNAFTQKHNMNISGGTQAVRYYASAGYVDAQGVVKGEHNKTYTGNINLTANVKNLTARLGANMSFQDRKYNPDNLGGVGVLNYAYGTNRAIPAYDGNGDPYYYQKYFYRDDNNALRTPFNIINDMENSYNASEVYTTALTASLDWQATSHLKLEATLSYKYSTALQDLYYGPDTYHARTLRGEGAVAIGSAPTLNMMPVGGELTETSTYNRSWAGRLQASYFDTIDKAGMHRISAVAGFDLSSNRYNTRKQMFRGYIERDQSVHYLDPENSANKGYYNWYYSTPLARGTHGYDLTNNVSGYAAVTYEYDDRYIFDATARVDASNQFGSRSRERLLPIWSFSGRWNVKKDFFRNVNWMNTLAIRASLGLQGNMLTTESSELIMEYSGKVNAENEFLSYIYSFPNLDLEWEKTTSTNLALDFSLFGNAVNGSFTYWYKHGREIFLNKNISAINGRDYYTVNSGEVTNRGIELGLSFTAINRASSANPGGLRWTIVPNLGRTLNKLLDKKDRTIKNEYTYNDYLNGTALVEGKSLNSFYSYKFTGLDPADGRPMFYGTDEEEFLPLYSEIGIDEMERIFMTAMEYSGRRVPIIQGGLANGISFGRFNVNFNLAFSLGAKVRLLRMYPNVERLTGTIAPQPDKNVRREFTRRWRGPGDEQYTDIPGVLTGSEFQATVGASTIWWKKTGTQFPFADNIWQMYDFSNLRVVNGDYLRLQSMSVRYTLPQNLSNKLYLNSAYVSLGATNLFTICSKKLNGQDPTTQSGSSATINLSNRPSYTLSLNLSF